ncbi:MAG: ferredoxin [Nanoarchaeota archaeon]
MAENKNTKEYIVELDREGCIGAGACAAIMPERFVMATDGKVDLKNAEQDGKNIRQVLIINEDELEKMKEAAESCPVNVIHIINKETKERLY